MSVASRLRGVIKEWSGIDKRELQQPRAADVPLAPPNAERPADPTATSQSAAPVPLNALLQIEEVRDAEFYVGGLFRRKFHSAPPDYGRHFAALYRSNPRDVWAVGYVHYMRHADSSWLCGGLVIDERLYRQMPDEHRTAIKARGGIAEALLSTTFERLRDGPAIWGYVGDRRSEVVCLRAGFLHTTHPHVMVVWNTEFSVEEQQRRIAQIVAFGPF